jgi:hypothetical protein
MRWMAGLAAVAGTAGLVAGTVVSGAAPAAAVAGAPSVVVVRSDRVWTATSVAVHAGDTVAIRGAGRMRFGAPPINRLTPLGIRRGPKCVAIGGARSEGWPAPDLNCWSLIARIGSAAPFAVGDARTVRVPQTGELQLGINDNHLEDNAGSWSATITVTPATIPTTPPTTGSRAKKTSIVLPVALGALVVLGSAGLLFVLRRRRRAEVVPPEATSAAPAAVGPVLEPPAPVDSTVGNFLDVEFAVDGSLSASYNHFPDDTVVTWSAASPGASRCTGEFVTAGGGDERHTIVIPATALEAAGRVADFDFSWTVGGVPFRYSVRRNVPAAAERLP